MNNKSPLRYPGGKTRACKILAALVDQHFKQINVIISPFFGGGSFEYFLQNKHNILILANDKFKPLLNFWQQVQNNQEELCKKLENKKTVSKEEFLKFRSVIMNEQDPIQQAFYYFIINRCSFSGATLSGGFSQEASIKRFTPSSIQRVRNLNLSNIRFSNEDFEDFINNQPNGFMFLDPPYYIESKLYGKNGDMHENFNHEKLAKLLKTRHNWMMTYNNCEYIKNLYTDCTIINVNWSYGMNKSKESSEIVILRQKKNQEKRTNPKN